MTTKKLEKVSTTAGVVLLVILALFGIMGCFKIVFNFNFFESKIASNVWTVIPLITCVLIFCCFLVSTMLNISRIAKSVEKIAGETEEK